MFIPTHKWLIDNGFIYNKNSSEIVGERNGWHGDDWKKGGDDYWEIDMYTYGGVITFTHRKIMNGSPYNLGTEYDWCIYGDEEGSIKLKINTEVECLNFIYHCVPYINNNY